MLTLIRHYSFYAIMSNAGKWFLTILAMSVSVALFVSVYLINGSSIRSFQEVNEALSNQTVADYEHRNGAIPESRVFSLRERFPDATVSPLSERRVSLDCQQDTRKTLQVLGVDVFYPPVFVKEVGGVDVQRDNLIDMLRTPYLSRGHIPEGCKLQIGSVSIPLQKEAHGSESTQPVIFMDLSWFQDLFHDHGYVQRIIVRSDAETLQDMQAYIASEWPDLVLRTPALSGKNAAVMTRAFRLNLLLLSGMGCVVAVFLLITMNWYQIVVRKPDFAILSELGVPDRTLFRVVLLESFFTSIITAMCGCMLGYFLAVHFLKPVNQTLAILYNTVEIASIHVFWSDLVWIVLGCLFVSWIGLYIPFADLDEKRHKKVVYFVLLIFSLSILLLGLCPLGSALDFYQGFFAPIGLILVALVIIPVLIRHGIVFLSHVSERLSTVTWFLSIQHVRASKAAGSFAITAVAFALGLSFSLVVMVSGFKQSVSDWLNTILGADIYVSSIHRDAPLPRAILKIAKGSDFVRATDLVQYIEEVRAGVPIRLYAVSLDVRVKENVVSWYQRPESTISCNGVKALISEPFHRRFNVAQGDNITSSSGLVLCVDGIIKDYSSEFGAVYINAADVPTDIDFGPVRSLSLFLHEGVDSDMIREKLSEADVDAHLLIRSQKELREYVLAVFDKTFSVPYVLQGITLSLSLIVVFVWVSIIAIQRREELQHLWTLGLSFSRLRRMLGLEAVIIGIFGLVYGLLLGLMLALVLVYVVNPHFFGWSLRLQVPYELIAMTSILTLLGSYVCGVIPARFLIHESFLDYEKRT